MAIILVVGCQAAEQQEGQPLARVHNRYLYLSEMAGMFPENASEEDSALIIKAFVRRWAKENVLLHEAERNIPSDLNIDRLVRDYRASLIRSNYERRLLEERLDTVVTQAELQQYYEENKDQYQLETSIIRGFFIKISQPTPEPERLRKLWAGGEVPDLEALRAYCDSYALEFSLQPDVWISLREVASEMPKGTLTPENVGYKREFTQQDEAYQYFFKLIELKNRREIAPLSYIKQQARKVILHSRKLKLLEQIREEMYMQELRHKNVEFFNP